MSTSAKILLLDDDQEFLEAYQRILSTRLSPQPTVVIASTGSRALALLDSEPFTLLIADLNLPKMDGLQVLSIASRKYPELKLMALTSIKDEQFRSRAYALGVDQYWIKPQAEHELLALLESLDGLLAPDTSGSFRGLQSKRLTDIIQLECMAQSTTLLKITQGIVEGRIWFHQGEVIDAETNDLKGEAAFQRILSWKAGHFAHLSGEPERPRTIFTSYQGLLMDTAQAIDEAASQAPRSEGTAEGGSDSSHYTSAPLLAELSQLPGVEFFLALGNDRLKTKDWWGIEDPTLMSEWVRETITTFNALGEHLNLGRMRHIIALGPQQQLSLTPIDEKELCVGFKSNVDTLQIRATMRAILTKWAS